MKPPTLEHHCSHLIIKHLDDRPEIETIQDWLDKQQLGIKIYIASYEIGKNKDKHVHAFCDTIFKKRYYNDHLKDTNWSFRLKFIDDSDEDRRKVISYIFKDGDDYHRYSKTKFFLDYRENKECSFKNLNIYDIWMNAKDRKERNMSPNKTQTEIMIDHLISLNKNQTLTKSGILKEIIKIKKSRKQLIQKNYLKSITETVLCHISEKYEKNLIESIIHEI